MANIITYFICGNGYGHLYRTSYILRFLKKTNQYTINAYVVTDRPPQTYPNVIDNLIYINPLSNPLPSVTDGLLISDNLLLPIWLNRFNKIPMILIGSFLWSRINDNKTLYSTIDSSEMESVLSFDNAYAFANKYFYDSSLFYKSTRSLFLHGLTNFHAHTSIKNSIKKHIYVSLGVSIYALEEAKLLYQVLSDPIFSSFSFLFDSFIWKNLSPLPSIYWINSRQDSHDICISSCEGLIIRPGLGTVNTVLCLKNVKKSAKLKVIGIKRL